MALVIVYIVPVKKTRVRKNGDPKMMTEIQRNELAEQIISELVKHAQQNGYSVNETNNPFLGTAFDIAYEIENPNEYNLNIAIEKARQNGCFESMKIRKFETEFPNPNEYIIARNENSRIGIFFDDSFGWCGEGYKKISRNEVPLNWFCNYQIFCEQDI